MLCVNSSLASLSGEIMRTSIFPASKSVFTSGHSSVLEELIVAALMPILSAAAIWFRMRASRGEIRSVGPFPLSRSSRVAKKYTKLLPQPVRCTTSSFDRSSIKEAIASHCPSRKSACVLLRAIWRSDRARFFNSTVLLLTC